MQQPRTRPRCRLQVTKLLSRRLIQQLRENGVAGRHGDDVTAGRHAADDDDDDDDDQSINQSINEKRL